MDCGSKMDDGGYSSLAPVTAKFETVRVEGQKAQQIRVGGGKVAGLTSAGNGLHFPTSIKFTMFRQRC